MASLKHNNRAQLLSPVSVDRSSLPSPVTIDLTKNIPRKRKISLDDHPAPPLELPFGETEFDPLEEPGDSTPEYEPVDDEDSDEDDLDGHDDEWLENAVRLNMEERLSSSIDVTHSKSKISFEDIPVLFQGPEQATKVDRFFVVERRSDPMSPVDDTGMGKTPGLQALEIWKRGDYGCGLRSALHLCPHYDTNRSGYNLLKWTARRRNIPFEFFKQGTHARNNGLHRSYLSNEDKFEREIKGLDLESIFDDMILQAHPNDSSKMKIAVVVTGVLPLASPVVSR